MTLALDFEDVIYSEFHSGRPQYNPSGSPVPYGGKPAVGAGLTVGARFPLLVNVVGKPDNMRLSSPSPLQQGEGNIIPPSLVGKGVRGLGF